MITPSLPAKRAGLTIVFTFFRFQGFAVIMIQVTWLRPVTLSARLSGTFIRLLFVPNIVDAVSLIETIFSQRCTGKGYGTHNYRNPSVTASKGFLAGVLLHATELCPTAGNLRGYIIEEQVVTAITRTILVVLYPQLITAIPYFVYRRKEIS